MSGLELFPPDAPLFVYTSSVRYSAARHLVGLNATTGTFASAAWPSANLAIYVPLLLDAPYPVKRVWWINGATASENVDLGLYKASGTREYSTGAVAQAGINALQYVTADLLIPPGEYYLGLSLSSATATTFSTAFLVTHLRMAGCLQQASAHVLPASMTGAVMTFAYYPLFGLTRSASGF